MSEEKKFSEMTPKERGREVLITLCYLAAGVVLALLISTFLIQKVTVEGTSMVNTLEEGDLLFGARYGVFYRDVDRFDIVVLDMGDRGLYVKRVIGLPGETVQIAGEEIYINGEVLDESYGSSDMRTPGIAEEPLTLGEGEYFVLGDNRYYSRDSRDAGVGVIREKQIMSKLGLRFWPISKFGIVR
ncbi:MAG: signal peptidase I [Lachnospiraceae bacterium]|nr:signal peptidase I [Lachnospiraceae bacterium]